MVVSAEASAVVSPFGRNPPADHVAEIRLLLAEGLPEVFVEVKDKVSVAVSLNGGSLVTPIHFNGGLRVNVSAQNWWCQYERGRDQLSS